VRTHRPFVLRSTLLVTVVLGSCSHPSPTSLPDHRAIRIASFNFPESELLAQLYAQALAAAGFPVELNLDLGPRELVEPALERGLVGFVPEYAGSALDFVSLGRSAATADAARTHELLRVAMAARDVAVLDAAPAQNQNGFAVTEETAQAYGLRAVSDLAPVAADMTFGGPVECPQRPLCLQGLRTVYGLRFESFAALDASGPLTAAGLTSGQVDVALVFTTDAYVDANHFVVLDDDRGLEPAENITPMVRRDVIDRFGRGFVDVVNAVSAKLTTPDVRLLNGELTLGEGTPATVARTWLLDHGLMTGIG
jgi:osmoprotectant transport system substrate-binding protein